jgi:hypothetical protein
VGVVGLDRTQEAVRRLSRRNSLISSSL